jgi:UDP-N-acetylglucosamine diphosphorylase/glucosamine-1-phosphate N-acetyltransferase
MGKEVNLFVYEDEKIADFYPAVYFRPVFDLLCGTTTLLEKILRVYPHANLHLLTREELAPIVRERYPSIPCNEWKSKSLNQKQILFLNGRGIFSGNILIPLEGKEEVFHSDGEIIGFRSNSDRIEGWNPEFPLREETLREVLKSVTPREVPISIARYPWNLFEWNGDLITQEFAGSGENEGILDERAVLQGDKQLLSIEKGSRVGPLCFLDVSNGPIQIERDVEVRPPSIIEGPAFIGNGTHIDGAKIRSGTSIGPVCRIAGEVEESVFQGYTNKHHEGFLGHAYVGEWVNLGAGTNNSDLKNNYSNVRVMLNEKEIDTGQMKIGCFIGDHTKTGIGSLITTGAVLGIFCNFFGGKGVSPKSVPSFSWGTNEPFAPYRLDEAIDTAKKVMERRDVTMTESYENLIQKLYSELQGSED